MPTAPIDSVNADLYPEPTPPYPVVAWVLIHDDRVIAWPWTDTADHSLPAMRYARANGLELPSKRVLSGPPDEWGAGTPEGYDVVTTDDDDDDDDTQTTTEPGTTTETDGLENQTVVELRALAADLDLKLQSTNKAGIIEEIRAAKAASTDPAE